MAQPEIQNDYQTDFYIEEASIITDRGSQEFSLDIRLLITDFEIYEHIEKPYLTGQIMFSDTYNVLQRIDIQGGEKLRLRIKATGTQESVIPPIEKLFYVERISKSTKTNEHTEVVVLRIVEDLAFVSTVKNVNKAHSGTPSVIIKDILKENLNRELKFDDDEYQGTMKVIVPNLHPLEAALWVKNRSTNTDGLPFYLFSSFADNYIRFFNLGSMLRQRPMNIENPYMYLESASAARGVHKHFVIQGYAYEDTENLLKLVRRGAVGSQRQYYDTLNGLSKSINFNANEDMFQKLLEKDYFSEDQNRFNHGPAFKIDGEEIGTYTSVVESQITNAGAFTGKSRHYKSLYEEDDFSAHKKRIIGDALKNFMTKTPITIQVKGRDFIQGESRPGGDPHYTIGNVIRIIFMDTTTDLMAQPQIDLKKSGDYIICGARHIFTKERYDVRLLCGKLASYKESVRIK